MKYLKHLETLINQAIDDQVFPGANYAIIFKDKIHLGSLGYKALYPQNETNSLDTRYDMASVSKVMATTTAILKLIENGQLRLFNRVNKYLPRFKHQQLTIWHLLTHCSGMRPCCIKPQELQSADQVWEQIYQFDLEYEPGTKIVYSDLNYIMLGKIVEIISGLRLDQYVDQVLFKPLAMNDTGYCPTDVNRCAPTEYRKDLDKIIRGYVHDETAHALGGVAGHAGVFSTIADVAKFIQMILNKGIGNDQVILSSSTINRLFEVQVSVDNGIMAHADRRGLGWIINSQNSSAGDLTSYDDTILHTGFTGTNVWIDRYHQVGFAMLTNRVHPTRENISHIEFRAKLANYIIAHLKELEREIN